MTKTHSKPMNKTLSNIISIITALSLVFLQVPVTGLHKQAVADSASKVKTQAVEKSSIDVPLYFEHAYIVYEGQVIGSPATKVTLPPDSDMEFEAEADSGYQLESVTAEIKGKEVELSADGGVYSLTAAEIEDTSYIYVSAITAPEVEQTAVEVEADEAEAAAPEAAQALEAAQPTETAAPEAAQPTDTAEPAPAAADASSAADATQAQATDAASSSAAADASSAAEGAAEAAADASNAPEGTQASESTETAQASASSFA